MFVSISDIKEDSMLSVTAADSQKWKHKREEKEKNMQSFGWQAFTADATYRSYKKTLKKLPTNSLEDNHLAESEANILSLEDKLLSRQGGISKVSDAGLLRLTKDLEDREKEKKHSRRRMHFEASDVDYINEDNAKFNKKIKRAYDKYTVEIRQNLERGTAI